MNSLENCQNFVSGIHYGFFSRSVITIENHISNILILTEAFLSGFNLIFFYITTKQQGDGLLTSEMQMIRSFLCGRDEMPNA